MLQENENSLQGLLPAKRGGKEEPRLDDTHCKISQYCKYGKRICCRECDQYVDCTYRCANTPDKCKLTRKAREDCHPRQAKT